ncbi:hypothetical protein RCO48_21630 [Peribacillus frigoritolerans]|nr:hypothetical protein [Peribacillus frigoritolerans]
MEKKTIIRRVLTMIALGLLLSVTIIAPKTGVGATYTPDMSNGADNFYKSNKVTMKKVKFKKPIQHECRREPFYTQRFEEEHRKIPRSLSGILWEQ